MRSEYIARFNEGVRTGDWSRMLDLLADDCELEFVGIPVGPFRGREAIAAAYREQPPDDEIVLLDGGLATPGRVSPPGRRARSISPSGTAS